MRELPQVPAACSLGEAGAAAQLARYRRAGAGARLVVRTPRRLVVALGADADPVALDEAVAVEAGCCPFIALRVDAAASRLEARVARAEEAPALDAIAFALGVAGC